MSEEILVNVTPQETRVAVLENGVLQEVHIERSGGKGIVGNIYQGKVVRVLPGMQAAFVDIGLDRTAFLHVADVVNRYESTEGDSSTAPTDDSAQGKRAITGSHATAGPVADSHAEDDAVASNPATAPAPVVTANISELLHDGQLLIVQVVKDPLGSKGARLTTHITIPARNLVYVPESSHIGVSQRIENAEERERLRQIMREALAETNVAGGFIIRTVAETASLSELRLEAQFLYRLWQRIQVKAKGATGITRIHEDIPLALRTMRDLVRENVERIRIDSRETYERACEFARDFLPESDAHIEYYPGERPIFDLYSVEDEVEKALKKNVPLKSGGYLVIDQTEAMTTVDVNTGAFVGRRNLEETLFKTNLEAAQAIARQLRLRNLGGIIIIDFIDMVESEHQRQVLRALDKYLGRDRVKTYITEMSPLGLVEVTRKRTRESLGHTLTEACAVCGGRGVLKTPQTVCYEIFREILREARQYEARELMVMASQVVIDILLDEESTALADLQEFIGTPIHLQVEQMYQQEVYDVVLMSASSTS